MTRRRSSYRSLASLQRDNRVCRACAEAGFPLESLPGRRGPTPASARTCSARRRASSRARSGGRGAGAPGKTLRRWLELDEDAFYATFYCASVTRCYPGRAPSGRGDRTPTPREQELCAFWRDWELRLLRPRLIVTVGGLAARRLLGLRERSPTCVGERFELGGASSSRSPHPSGASGWLNDRPNRERVARAALELVREELDRLHALARTGATGRSLRFERSERRGSLSAHVRRACSASCARTGGRSSSRSLLAVGSQAAAIAPRVPHRRRDRPRDRPDRRRQALDARLARARARRRPRAADDRPAPDLRAPGARRRVRHAQRPLRASSLRLSFGFYDRHQTGPADVARDRRPAERALLPRLRADLLLPARR